MNMVIPRKKKITSASGWWISIYNAAGVCGKAFSRSLASPPPGGSQYHNRDLTCGKTALPTPSSLLPHPKESPPSRSHRATETKMSKGVGGVCADDAAMISKQTVHVNEEEEKFKASNNKRVRHLTVTKTC